MRGLAGIARRCGTKVACLAPYAPSETKVMRHDMIEVRSAGEEVISAGIAM